MHIIARFNSIKRYRCESDKDLYILKAVGIRMKDICICLGLNRTDFSILTNVNISSIQK